MLNIPDWGKPVLSTVKCDGIIIAMHLGFELNKDTFLYQIPALDVSHKSKSPGTILLKSILDYIVDFKLDCFDMGYGLEDYKFRYMNDSVLYSTIVKFKHPLLNIFYRFKFL